jgi:hypothetical protein
MVPFQWLILRLRAYPVRQSNQNDALRVDRQVDRKPFLVGAVKGHNTKEISFPGRTAPCAGSFNYIKEIILEILE